MPLPADSTWASAAIHSRLPGSAASSTPCPACANRDRRTFFYRMLHASNGAPATQGTISHPSSQKVHKPFPRTRFFWGSCGRRGYLPLLFGCPSLAPAQPPAQGKKSVICSWGDVRGKAGLSFVWAKAELAELARPRTVKVCRHHLEGEMMPHSHPLTLSHQNNTLPTVS